MAENALYSNGTIIYFSPFLWFPVSILELVGRNSWLDVLIEWHANCDDDSLLLQDTLLAPKALRKTVTNKKQHSIQSAKTAKKKAHTYYFVDLMYGVCDM